MKNRNNKVAVLLTALVLAFVGTGCVSVDAGFHARARVRMPILVFPSDDCCPSRQYAPVEYQGVPAPGPVVYEGAPSYGYGFAPTIIVGAPRVEREHRERTFYRDAPPPHFLERHESPHGGPQQGGHQGPGPQGPQQGPRH